MSSTRHSVRALRAVFAVALFCILSTHAPADILHVPGDYPTIQEAINAAENGDEVVLAEGEYFENINLDGKAITVRSTDPTNGATVARTIINGNGVASVVTCNSSEGPDTVLSGLVITNGDGGFEGGGLYCNAGPTVMNCTFSENVAELGGGIRCGGNPIIHYCTFSRNTAAVGGAIFSDGNPTLTKCSFIKNTADSGGGVFAMYDSIIMTGCTFIGNVATGDEGWAKGSAVHGMCEITRLYHCTFTDNSCAGLGGGVYINACLYGTLTNCEITGNAPFGLYVEMGSPLLAHCIICGNEESEIHGHYVDTGNNIIGPHTPPPAPECPADLDGDADVDTADLLALLAAWGMCP
jgi:predicted outer membrane repeat protein